MTFRHTVIILALGAALSAVTGCGTTEDYDSWTTDQLAAPTRISDKLQLVRLRYDGQPWHSGLTRQEFIREFGRLSYESQRVYMPELQAKVDIHCGSSLENVMTRMKSALKKPVADLSAVRTPESIAALDIRAHPVLVMVGGNNFDISMSNVGTNAVRTYCLQRGGVLLVSCGGPLFDKSFRKFAKDMFPGIELKEVPRNHTVFKKPYYLPSGSPPLWHHAGKKLLGMEKDGRWFMFYHPGNINDAWKSSGMGISPGTRAAALSLGVNIVSYALDN